MKKMAMLAVPALIAVAGVGCSKAESPRVAEPTRPSISSSVDGSDDPGDDPGVVRIPLGATAKVLIPADAVLDIKGDPAWDKTVLRCTATTSDGKPLELLTAEPGEPEQAAHGGVWVALWSVGAAPGELVVGCSDPDKRIPNSDTAFVRVVPRGIWVPGR
ncbi:hypothetical protein ACWIGW_16370 [Nocardia brasiliensis]